MYYICTDCNANIKENEADYTFGRELPACPKCGSRGLKVVSDGMWFNSVSEYREFEGLTIAENFMMSEDLF